VWWQVVDVARCQLDPAMTPKEVVSMQPQSRAEPKTGSRAGWLTPNVRVLCGVSFFQDAASELLYPILPIFLTVTLGAPVAVVGAVEGAAEGVAALSKTGPAPTGWPAQRWQGSTRLWWGVPAAAALGTVTGPRLWCQGL